MKDVTLPSPHGPNLCLEPAIEDGIADTGTHRDKMTETQSEVVDLHIMFLVLLVVSSVRCDREKVCMISDKYIRLFRDIH